MPICTQSSSGKPNGFSIDAIIKKDGLAANSKRLSSPSPSSSTSSSSSSSSICVPLVPWLPSQTTAIYQYQRESMLQYLRQNSQLANPALATLFLNPYRKPKRNRTAFTPAQLLKLENAFEKNHYIVGQERKDLAKHLNLPEAKVKVWYQNRRTKHKRLINEDASHSVHDVDPNNEPNTRIRSTNELVWDDDDQTDIIHE